MKSFHKETNTNTATLLMDVVPLIMSRIRTEMRSNRMPGLSIPQFRTLIFLYRHKDATLSQVAEHVGLKLPSTSKMIDALVIRNLVIRNASPEDRRCVRLRLSPSGFKELTQTRYSTEHRLSEILSVVTSEQQAIVFTALQSLRPLFVGEKSPSQRDEK